MADRSGFFAGREGLAGDFSGVGGGAVALAMLQVSVEGVPGLGAEPGAGHYVDAVYGVGPGLLPGDGDVPQLDYVVGGSPEAKHGEDAGELALGGVDLAAKGGAGYSGGVGGQHFFIFLSFPVIWGFLNCALAFSGVTLFV